MGFPLCAPKALGRAQTLILDSCPTRYLPNVPISLTGPQGDLNGLIIERLQSRVPRDIMQIFVIPTANL